MIEAVVLQHVTDLGALAYLLIFIGMLFEGEVILFAAAFLTHAGILEVAYVLPVVVAGVLLGDTGWYFIGRLFGKKLPLIQKILVHIERRFGERLRTKPYSTFIITKFTYGLHRTALLAAGALHLRVKSFLASDFVASFVWIAGIWALAYASAQSYHQLRHTVRYAELGLLGGLVVLFIIHHLLARFSKTPPALTKK